MLPRKKLQYIVTIFIVGVFFHYRGCFFHYRGCFFIIVCVFSLSWVLFPYSINSKIFNMCIHQLGFYRECLIFLFFLFFFFSKPHHSTVFFQGSQKDIIGLYVSQPLYSRPIIDHFGRDFTVIEPLWQICKIKKMNHGQKIIYLSPK